MFDILPQISSLEIKGENQNIFQINFDNSENSIRESHLEGENCKCFEDASEPNQRNVPNSPTKIWLRPDISKMPQAWLAMDKDNSGYITRAEFITKARQEVEKILNDPGN